MFHLPEDFNASSTLLATCLMCVANLTGSVVSLNAQTLPSNHVYYVYVCAESDDEVALVKFGPDGGELVKNIRVGSIPGETEGPHGISVSPNGRYWYVSIAHGVPFGSVHKYETNTDTWVGGTTLGMFPATLAISASTGLLFAVNFNLHGSMVPGTISIVETETMTEVDRVETGIMPHGSRFDRQGIKHYSVAMMSDTLVEVDAFNFEVTRQLKLPVTIVENGRGDKVASMAAHATVQPTWVTSPTPQGKVYVAGNAIDTIFEVDLKEWQITSKFEHTGKGPYNIDTSPDGRMLVVTYKRDATIGFWDLNTGEELARRTTTRRVPHGVLVTPDGEYAFITLEGIGGEPGTVEVYHLKTQERVAVVDVGMQAGGIAFWKMDP